MTGKDDRDPETHAIIGAAMAVHSELGCGFLEAVYQEALEMEMADRSVRFAPQVELKIRFKGRELQCKYCADFICFKTIIVEIKAIKTISNIERAQVINYLKATGIAAHYSLTLEPRAFSTKESSDSQSSIGGICG